MALFHLVALGVPHHPHATSFSAAGLISAAAPGNGVIALATSTADQHPEPSCRVSSQTQKMPPDPMKAPDPQVSGWHLRLAVRHLLRTVATDGCGRIAPRTGTKAAPAAHVPGLAHVRLFGATSRHSLHTRWQGGWQHYRQGLERAQLQLLNSSRIRPVRQHRLPPRHLHCVDARSCQPHHQRLQLAPHDRRWW
jgi:hypothetical protein